MTRNLDKIIIDTNIFWSIKKGNDCGNTYVLGGFHSKHFNRFEV